MTKFMKSLKPKRFVRKIYEIVSNPANKSSITWTECGLCFEILNLHSFSKEILPMHFKHKNSSSFIRQLNLYNFQKKRHTGDVLVYSHPNFIRGEYDKLVKVVRKLPEYKENHHKSLHLLTSQSDKKLFKIKSLQTEVEKINILNKELIEKIKNITGRVFSLELISHYLIQELIRNSILLSLTQ